MALGLLQRKPRELNKVVLLPITQIERNPFQPRKVFDSAAIIELSDSISENGLLQPITVRKTADERYELIAGERRLRAYKHSGHEMIPAIVDSFSDKQSAVLALVENLQRRDLNFFEEALGIYELISELGQTQIQVCKKLGVAQSTVANKLRLLKLPAYIQNLIITNGLTERHARALLKLPENELLATALHIIDAGLNVDETERYIASITEPEPPVPEKAGHKRTIVIKDVRIFSNTIKKAVDLMLSSGIPVDSKKSESADYIEYFIRIPKQNAYKPATPETGK